MEVESRLFDKIHDTGHCWEWTAATDHHGYGQFWLEGQMRGAHRVVYQFMVGEIPDGLDLDHLCRNPGCVNPDHLDPVPRSVNMRRVPRPSLCPQGHDNWKADHRGSRICRTCKADEQRLRRARQKEESSWK